MPYFDGAVGRVYYREWAVTQPVAAVAFLHGFGEHTGVYHRLAGALGARGISLWALDEIGHGLSDGERGRIDSLDDLVANGQKLTDLAAATGLPIVLAGHSLGGVAAALTAVRHPARYAGLVLSGTPLQSPGWMTQLLEAPDEIGSDFALDATDLSSDPFYLDQLENDPLAFTEADVLGTLTRSLPPAWDELSTTFADVKLPVLAVHGAEDPIAPVEDAVAWSARINGCIETFPGSKHDVLNDTAHAQVAAVIADFVVQVADRWRQS